MFFSTVLKTITTGQNKHKPLEIVLQLKVK